MSEYEVESWELEPVEGDEQISLVIVATDGNRWEYGIPYTRRSGRYTFEEIDVIANDFGDDIAEDIVERLEELIAELC